MLEKLDFLNYAFKGDGTKDNPYIIKNEDFHLDIFFDGGDSFINIFNCDIDSIRLLGCSNILIENCHINRIVVNRCHNINLQSNEISLIKNIFCNRLILFQNKICEFYDINNQLLFMVVLFILSSITLLISSLLISLDFIYFLNISLVFMMISSSGLFISLFVPKNEKNKFGLRHSFKQNDFTNFSTKVSIFQCRYCGKKNYIETNKCESCGNLRG